MKSLNNIKLIIKELSALIEHSRREIVTVAISSLTLLYWNLGKKLNEEIIYKKGADYGKKVVIEVPKELVQKYGRSFEEKNLRRMIQISDIFEEYSIVVTLSRQLTWSHILLLLPLKNEELALKEEEKKKL